jgi:hypothetical protein
VRSAQCLCGFVRVMARGPRSAMRILIVQILRECSRGAGFRRTTDGDGQGVPAARRYPYIVITYIVLLYIVIPYIVIL